MAPEHAETYQALGRLDYEFHGFPKIPPVYGDAQEEYFRGYKRAERLGVRFNNRRLREAVRIDKMMGRAYTPPQVAVSAAGKPLLRQPLKKGKGIKLDW